MTKPEVYVIHHDGKPIDSKRIYVSLGTARAALKTMCSQEHIFYRRNGKHHRAPKSEVEIVAYRPIEVIQRGIDA